jgi:superfamily II DNA or RNA helicase
MSSEAIDISSLNAVILATPRRKVEQSTGRILRKEKGQYIVRPLIIDVIDNLRPFMNQSYGRKTYYKTITKNEDIKSFKYENGELIEEKLKTSLKKNDSDDEELFASDSD